MVETKCGFNDGNGLAGSGHLVVHGPTLLVDIGLDLAYDVTNSASPPSLAETKLWALVDTGATESCIDLDLAQRLALPLVDRRHIGGVSGRQEVGMYMAHVHIPSLNYTIHGLFAGVNLIAGGQRHYALIGRTFLRSFKMTYNGRTGDVTLQYLPE
jgi:hypothetical protein